MDFGLKDSTLAEIKSVLASFQEVEEAVLFGSRAKGNYKPGSDIDIAIKGEKCTGKTALEINAILNERVPLPYQFDVVNYSTIVNPDFIAHINRVGISFYSKAK